MGKIEVLCVKTAIMYHIISVYTSNSAAILCYLPLDRYLGCIEVSGRKSYHHVIWHYYEKSSVSFWLGGEQVETSFESDIIDIKVNEFQSMNIFFLLISIIYSLYNNEL